MTQEIFRDDAYAKSCEATVLAVEQRGVVLNRTIFYYEAGGQPGDTGSLTKTDGTVVNIIDTQMDKSSGQLLHITAPGEVELAAGDRIIASINWDRRYRLMRMHSALHVLCAVVDAQVTGAKVDFQKSRIDFNPDGVTIDKFSIQASVDALIAANHPLTVRWITDKELEVHPELVRTMSVSPPTGVDKVRLVEIEGADLQPCGGTHVSSTSEIGKLLVGKIESKGKFNRRITVSLAD